MSDLIWEPEAREKFHKQFGDYRLIPERNKAGQTAHLIDLGDRKIRVLPDDTHSGQKRATVVRVALETLADATDALEHDSGDLAGTYLIGALARAGLEWEYVPDDLRSRSIEEWLVEWFSMPDERWIPRPPADKISADLLHALDVDGWEIRRKGAE